MTTAGKYFSEDITSSQKYLEAGTPMVVFDLETTGTKTDTAKILTFSAQKYVLEGGYYVRKDRLELLLDPEMHIPEKASEVNGITDDMVKGMPTEREGLAEIIPFLGKSPLLCGFRSKKYDLLVLNAALKRNGKREIVPLAHVDVWEMARRCLELPDYKLQTVTHRLGCDLGIKFHASEDDVLATFRCYCVMIREFTFDKPKGIHPQVTSVNYWEGGNHTKRRVYVNTIPYAKSYYDIYRNVWVSDLPEMDLDALKEEALRFEDASDEKELVKKIKG